MKTYSAKQGDTERKWYLVDASEAPLGRVASAVAIILLGKDKATFTKNVDTGDFVVVINAEKLQVTGRKMDTKMYYHHSGYLSGIKQMSLRDMQEKDPTRALFHAIRGMLPENKLRDGRLERLKIYAGGEHTHEAQKPQPISIKDVKGSK